jgi:hypothetical protein
LFDGLTSLFLFGGRNYCGEIREKSLIEGIYLVQD